MSNLLSANFLRLRKNKCFWGCTVIMAAAGIYFPVANYFEMKRFGYITNLDSNFFTCAVFAAVLLSVFCSLFVGTEYSDGTIRNKIIIGHKRTDIYLANLITNMTAGLIMCAVYFIAYLCTGIPLLGFFEADIKIILLFVVTVIILSFAFCAIFTMVGMNTSSKALIAVICILSACLLLLVGTYINSRLQEPEYYNNYVLTENGVETGKEVKNATYLEGTKRKIYEFLNDFLPGGQVVQCASMEAKNPQILPVYSIIIFVITTSAGIIIFRRKDLK